MATRSTFGGIRKLPSKLHQARYTGPDGKRYNAPTLFQTKTDARSWLSGIQTSISNGSWLSPDALIAGSVTFEERAEIWLGLHKKEHTPRYHGELRRMLKGPRLAKFRSMNIKDIDRNMVDKWWGQLPDTPTENARVYAFMNCVMLDALDRDLITKNPCKIKGGSTVERVAVITILADQKVRELAQRIGGRYVVMVLVAAYLCLRFGELTELRRKDLVDGSLLIRRGVTWVHPEDVPAKDRSKVVFKALDGRPLKKVALPGPPKSKAGVRDIPIPDFLRPLLAQHILQYAEPGDEGLIFPRASGGHMPNANLWRVFMRARKEIDREDLAWHHLRHTGAVTWALEGATVKELMELLGHETPDMAMHYQHVAEGRLKTLAERVSQRVTGSLMTEDLTIEVDPATANAMAAD